MASFDWVADNVTRCVIEAHWTNGNQIINIIDVEREEDDPQQSAERVRDAWQDNVMRDLLPNNYALDGVRYEDHNELGGVVGFVTPNVALPVTGVYSAAATPPNTAYLVHKNIEGRRGARSGRMYLCSPSEATTTEDGRFSDADVAAYNVSMDDFFDAAHESGGLGGDGRLVVVHLTVLGAHDATPSVSTITSLTVDQTVASMRRRLR